MTDREKLDLAINEILKAKMEDREPDLPEGVTCHISYGPSSKLSILGMGNGLSLRMADHFLALNVLCWQCLTT